VFKPWPWYTRLVLYGVGFFFVFFFPFIVLFFSRKTRQSSKERENKGRSIYLSLEFVVEPEFFKWRGKLLINIWYYMLYIYIYMLYIEINLKYMYQLKLSKINLRILLKWKKLFSSRFYILKLLYNNFIFNFIKNIFLNIYNKLSFIYF